MKKMVGFGDYLLRLNPEGYLRFIQADHFQINYTCLLYTSDAADDS